MILQKYLNQEQLFKVCLSVNSRSNLMLSWEMPSKNIFFAYFASIMGTLKGSSGQFFNFSIQSQNFTVGLTGPNLQWV